MLSTRSIHPIPAAVPRSDKSSDAFHMSSGSPRTLSAALLMLASGSAAKSTLGIHVHGCHVDADGFDSVVWGSPPERLGRLPHAALLAWEERDNLACITMGTGASRTVEGVLEGDHALALLLERLPQLVGFHAFRDVPLDELELLLRRTGSSETSSENTSQEVRSALQHFEAMGVKRAVLVSSPTHLPRCLACACAVAEQEPSLFSGSMWASPSMTSYEGFGAVDVVVVEPPHRGDRDRSLEVGMPHFHDMVGRSYKIDAGQRRRFLEQLDALLCRFGV